MALPEVVPDNLLPDNLRKAAHAKAQAQSDLVPADQVPEQLQRRATSAGRTDDLVPDSEVPDVGGMARTWAKQYHPEPVPGVVTPAIDAMVVRASKKYGVDPREIRALLGIESAGGRNPGRSTAGARGMLQLMPDTARGLGVKNVDDPEQNIDGGTRYFASLKKRFGGDAIKAAMAYNMGPYGLQRALAAGYGSVPMETRNYAARFYEAMNTPDAVPEQPTVTTAAGKHASAVAVRPHIQQAGVGSGVTDAIHKASELLHEGVQASAIGWYDAAHDTMGAINALFGAPQRAVQGAMHGGVNEAVSSFFHPNDEHMQRNELDHVIDMLHLPVEKGNDIKSRLIRLVEEFGAQTLTDPVNIVPFVGEVKIGVRAIEVLNKIREAAKASGVALPEIAKIENATRSLTKTGFGHFIQDLTGTMEKAFGRRPELNPHLTQEAKGARLSIEQKHRTFEAKMKKSDDALLAKHKDALQGTKSGSPLPPEIQRRYLQEPWRHGTAQMRADAERLGYKADVEDRTLFPHPTGDLHYDVRDEYQTMIKPRKGAKWEDTELIKTAGGKHKEEFRGFEKKRTAEGALPEDQYALVENRLQLGRARVRQQATDAETEQFLRQYGGWKGKGPIDVSQSSHSPKCLIADQDNALFKLLYAPRTATRAAISLNPLPHGLKNVGMLAYLHGGPEAFGKGVAYAMKGLSKEQRDRLQNMGADVEYVRDIEGPLKYVAEHTPGAVGKGLDAAHNVSSGSLTRLEMGYRQALLDQLDRKLGKSEIGTPLEYQKSQIIRDALGDYRNNSIFVSALSAIGGPFVAFRLGIVPEAVGRAMIRRPGHVESIARAQNDFNDTVMQGKPSKLEIGGPLGDFMGLLTDPLKYLRSPATIGALAEAKYLDPNTPKGAGQMLDDAGRMIVPFFNTAEDTGAAAQLIGGYGSAPGVDPASAGLASLLGSYFRVKPSGKVRRRFIYKERRAK